MEEKVYLKRKLHPQMLFTVGCGALALIFGLQGAIFVTGQWDIAVLAIFLGGGLLLLSYQMDRGYQLAFDNGGIYMREAGFAWPLRRKPERRLSYDELAHIEGKFWENEGLKSRFMPFEYIELQSRFTGVDDITIYPPAFPDREIKNFLFVLYDRRPDLFSEDILKYMHSAKPL